MGDDIGFLYKESFQNDHNYINIQSSIFCKKNTYFFQFICKNVPRFHFQEWKKYKLTFAYKFYPTKKRFRIKGVLPAKFFENYYFSFEGSYFSHLVSFVHLVPLWVTGWFKLSNNNWALIK